MGIGPLPVAIGPSWVLCFECLCVLGREVRALHRARIDLARQAPRSPSVPIDHRSDGTACLGEHVTSAVRGSTLVDVALQDVPSVVRAAVAQIPRASVSELDDDGATLTQRSGVVIPRVEVISLAFRRTPRGKSEVVIVRARRGGLSAPDPVLSEFEQSLLSSIRAAAEEASP